MRRDIIKLILPFFLSLFSVATLAFDFKDNDGKICYRVSDGNAIVTYFSMSETENAAHYDESGTWDSSYQILREAVLLQWVKDGIVHKKSW